MAAGSELCFLRSARAMACLLIGERRGPRLRKTTAGGLGFLLNHCLPLSKAYPLAFVTLTVNSRCLVTILSPSEHCRRTRWDAAAPDIRH